MAKQIVKGLTMLLMIVGLALATAVVSANGQSRIEIRADIPFEFTVGSQSLPAGKYGVKTMSVTGETVAIRSNDSRNTVLRLSNELRASEASETAKLVFHRYGNRYFLSEVWTSGERSGRQLLKSKQERSIENQLAAVPSKGEFAASSYELVVVLASIR